MPGIHVRRDVLGMPVRGIRWFREWNVFRRHACGLDGVPSGDGAAPKLDAVAALRCCMAWSGEWNLNRAGLGAAWGAGGGGHSIVGGVAGRRGHRCVAHFELLLV